jgi:hypothetical protein
MLVILTIALLVASRGHGHGDWPDFAAGSRLLFGDHPAGATKPGGFEIYRSESDLFIGPLALVVVRILVLAGGYWTAAAVFSLAGVGLVWTIERLAARIQPATRARDVVVLLGGTMFLVGWVDLVTSGHVEDALALAFVIGAMWGVATQQWLLVGVFLGLAIASKQWAVTLIPLVLALDDNRAKVRAVVTAAIVNSVAWAPFVIAAPVTLRAGTRTILAAVDSFPAVVGVAPGGTLIPDWYRPVELIVILGCAVFVARRHWPALLFVAVGIRLAFDPSTYTYYSGGLLLGALILDTADDLPFPIWTLASFLLVLEAHQWIDAPWLRVMVRIALVVVATAYVAGPRRYATAVTAPAGSATRAPE